jgi:hypothetical protein
MQSKFSAQPSSSEATILPIFAPKHQEKSQEMTAQDADITLAKYTLAISQAVDTKYNAYQKMQAEGKDKLSVHENMKKQAIFTIKEKSVETGNLIKKLAFMESYLADDTNPEIAHLKEPNTRQIFTGLMTSTPASSDTYAGVIKATFELRCDLQKLAPDKLPPVPENLQAHYQSLAQSSSSAGPARKFE